MAELVKEATSEHVNGNQLLESVSLLTESYNAQLSKVANVALPIIQVDKEPKQAEREKVKQSAELFIQKISADNFQVALIAIAKIIEIWKTTENQLEPIDAKAIKGLVLQKIEFLIMKCLHVNSKSLAGDPARLQQALSSCMKICDKMYAVGWKTEAMSVRSYIGNQFKMLEMASFNEAVGDASREIYLLSSEQSGFLDNVEMILKKFVEGQKEKLIQSPAAMEKAVEWFQQVINNVQGKVDTIQLKSSLGNICKGIVEEVILSNKEKLAGDPALAQQLIDVSNRMDQHLRKMGLLEAADSLNFQLAQTLEEAAVKYVEANKDKFSQDPKTAIQACRLCGIASNALRSKGYSERASNLESLTKDVVIEEQRKFEEFLTQNLEAIKQDPKMATQALELCNKMTQSCLKMGLPDKALEILSLAAKHIPIPHIESHPLINLTNVVQNAETPKLGARVSGLDTGILKGGTLCLRERDIENNKTICIDFSVNQLNREYLGGYVKEIQANPDKFYQNMPEGLCKGIKIHEKNEFTFNYVENNQLSVAEQSLMKQTYTMSSKTIEIEFVGLGKVILANDPECRNLYNSVSIELEPGSDSKEALQKLHQMVVCLGLGPVFEIQRDEDVQRMKIGQLYRAYYPAKAYLFERTPEFYELPVEKLMEKIIGDEKGMKSIFKKYLQEKPELMVKEEIYPGESMWTIGDFDTQLKEKGALGSISKLTGDMGSGANLNTLVSIVEIGLLSSMDRFSSNIATSGMSSKTDIGLGSGKEVFTRLVTKNNIEDYDIANGCHILVDLEVVNRVTYLHDKDLYGSKADWEYKRERA